MLGVFRFPGLEGKAFGFTRVLRLIFVIEHLSVVSVSWDRVLFLFFLLIFVVLLDLKSVGLVAMYRLMIVILFLLSSSCFQAICLGFSQRFGQSLWVILLRLETREGTSRHLIINQVALKNDIERYIRLVINTVMNGLGHSMLFHIMGSLILNVLMLLWNIMIQIV